MHYSVPIIDTKENIKKIQENFEDWSNDYLPVLTATFGADYIDRIDDVVSLKQAQKIVENWDGICLAISRPDDWFLSQMAEYNRKVFAEGSKFSTDKFYPDIFLKTCFTIQKQFIAMLKKYQESPDDNAELAVIFVNIHC